MTIKNDVTSLGLNESRWRRVHELAEKLCADDEIPSMGLCIGRSDQISGISHFGRQRIAADSEPIRDDAIYLIASITKPIVAMGVLRLVEEGEVSLGDRVCDYIPEFGGAGRYGITLRHLLTHTSGLPDMLPNNKELRIANAPLEAFVEATCQSEPAFPPGRGVQYQSMGFALLGEIIKRVRRVTCSEFLRTEFFEPLEMHDTELGAPASWFDSSDGIAKANRIAEIRLPEGQHPDDGWNWNSRYWRSLGAPWGGLLTTPADLARFAQMMLNEGWFGDRKILSQATIAAATRNQLNALRGVPEEDRRIKPWGLGWRLNWPAHSANFGDLLGPRTYGHWGATGTVLWIDPDLEAFALVLSTEPQEPHGKWIARLSNVIASAFL
ncbi:MAG: serine hydrolase domain-containing protein [Planctomycetaceae bacterium]